MPKVNVKTIGSSRGEPKSGVAEAPAPVEGWLLSLTRSTLVMEDEFGGEIVKTVDIHARITLDGEMCDPRVLDPGTRIRVSTSERDRSATVIDALGRQARFAKAF
jgi:hypothetical protein